MAPEQRPWLERRRKPWGAWARGPRMSLRAQGQVCWLGLRGLAMLAEQLAWRTARRAWVSRRSVGEDSERNQVSDTTRKKNPGELPGLWGLERWGAVGDAGLVAGYHRGAVVVDITEHIDQALDQQLSALDGLALVMHGSLSSIISKSANDGAVDRLVLPVSTKTEDLIAGGTDGVLNFVTVNITVLSVSRDGHTEAIVSELADQAVELVKLLRQD